MPGIFGFINKRGSSPDLSRSLIEKMARLQYHNSAYRIETISDDWFGLGWIDIPQNGFVKLKDDTERGIAAAYNGFVYGHGDNNEFPSTSQIDKFIDYYRQDENEIFRKLNGSFNAAFFDRIEKKSLIFNDRLGHRHLYYYETDELFLFAGEFKAFYASEKFKPELDYAGVADFVNYFFTLGDKTLLKDVKRLPWGYWIKYNGKDINIAPYHEFKIDEISNQSIDELIEEAHSLYEDNLKRQSVGSDRIVIPLSGGLDSRMVIGHASRGELPVETFTHGSKGCLDERVARRVAASADGCSHRLIEIDPAWIATYAEQLIYLTGGVLPTVPAILMGVIPQYNGNPERTTLLNGISGRTVFGYGYYNEDDIGLKLSLHEKANRLRRPLIGDMLDDSYYAMIDSDLRDRIRKTYYSEIEKEIERYTSVSDDFCHQRDFFMLDNRLRRNFDQVDINRYFYHDHMALEDDRTLSFYLKIPPEIKAYPTRTLLIEGLKKKFKSLAKIPTQNTGVNLYQSRSDFSKKTEKLSKRINYYLERITAGKIRIPDKTTYVHFNQWYRKYPEISRLYEETLIDDRTYSRGILNRERISEVLERQRKGGNSYHDLALVLSIELFCRIYIDNPQMKERADKMQRGPK